MKIFKSLSLVTVLLLSLAVFAQGAAVTQTAGPITATYTQQEYITITLGGAPTFAIPTTGNSPAVTATVSYGLTPANHTNGIQFAAWLGSALGLTSGSNAIPPSNFGLNSNIHGNNMNTVCNGATAVNLVGGTAPGVANAYCGNGMALSQTALTAAPSGSWTDTFTANVTVAPTNAGTYTGTVYLFYAAF